MSTAPQDLLDAAELIGELPSFAALPRFARTLVAERLEQQSYPFGSAIVREGDEADAFYVDRFRLGQGDQAQRAR